jgi:DNA repair ATPase RecN
MTQEELDKLMASGDFEQNDAVENLRETLSDISKDSSSHQDDHLIAQLDDVTKESEKKASEVFDNLDTLLAELDTLQNSINDSKTIENSIEKMRNLIFETMSIMQYQDIHRQKIERVINTMSAISVLMNDTLNSVRTFTPSAKHIIGDKSTDDVVGNDDIEALIASMK